MYCGIAPTERDGKGRVEPTRRGGGGCHSGGATGPGPADAYLGGVWIVEAEVEAEDDDVAIAWTRQASRAGPPGARGGCGAGWGRSAGRGASAGAGAPG